LEELTFSIINVERYQNTYDYTSLDLIDNNIDFVESFVFVISKYHNKNSKNEKMILKIL
jgi:hypothetical protein